MLPQVKSRVDKILELAERIESDIRRRRLKAGDRYYNTVAAAKMLGVDTGAVNRALQLLVKRNVIVRRQRSGTFVASGPGAEDCPLLRQVHLLMGDSYPQMEGWFNHEVMLALQDEEEIEENVCELLRDKKNPPGIIVRSPKMAESIMGAIRAKGLAPHKQVPLAVSDYFGTEAPPYPYIRTQGGRDDQAARLGRFIWSVSRGKTIDPRDQLLPVRLEIPSGILVVS